ncbi:uncharacterized protein N7511_010998 [Penicillium nucicola]|uniref:uncharacterized protein n=1 Tax=Penicillium nucicola TaxID=1850975 RepID=UPI0025457839|nr:uncharacterized protein N7511_010998 [Penicillium nucicola]KAJ5749302.1 hypothetical protein N7511_010998 [Penicillium nucicola]
MTDQYGDTWSTTYDAYNAPDTRYDTTSSMYDTLGDYEPSGYESYGATGYGAVGFGADPTGSTYDNHDIGYGATTYDPNTGAYDQHLDYRTPAGRRHHRERVDQHGTFRHRDVDRYEDGSARVHKEYDNPNTGTSYHRDYEK